MNDDNRRMLVVVDLRAYLYKDRCCVRGKKVDRVSAKGPPTRLSFHSFSPSVLAHTTLFLLLLVTPLDLFTYAALEGELSDATLNVSVPMCYRSRGRDTDSKDHAHFVLPRRPTQCTSAKGSRPTRDSSQTAKTTHLRRGNAA
ncbi:hypothetical protein M413DRAFT_447840 [Hebeloma cylindrosporum]|uniref:Uncharacterized protein n=1 Tax=Hebeloma cylindrosporum TaxID=76867 RepID=A0A0C3C248_HEBCY|nr:hypothetical protein M413DRAFT_447840 [Hebeloma cylindrosporum h7]